MTRIRSIVLSLFAALMLTMSTASTASADTLVWYVKSSHPNSVMIEFYSQDRSHAWPGDGTAYVIKDWDFHEYSLECRSGEKICYGAWVQGDSSSYWGTGKDDRDGCDSCCYICDGYSTTRDIELLP